jgi:hypothetical protein
VNKKEEVERIFERAKYEALALVCSESAPTAASGETWGEWLTEEELMKYWSLDSNAGLRSWRKRPADQFPLPHARMGELIRFNRNECDQWAREEAIRQRQPKKPTQPNRGGLFVATPEGGNNASL